MPGFPMPGLHMGPPPSPSPLLHPSSNNPRPTIYNPPQALNRGGPAGGSTGRSPLQRVWQPTSSPNPRPTICKPPQAVNRGGHAVGSTGRSPLQRVWQPTSSSDAAAVDGDVDNAGVKAGFASTETGSEGLVRLKPKTGTRSQPLKASDLAAGRPKVGRLPSPQECEDFDSLWFEYRKVLQISKEVASTVALLVHKVF
eukprot:gene32222-16781_t